MVGLYRSMEDALPEWVVSFGYLKEVNPDSIQFSIEFMSIFSKIYHWFAILHPSGGEAKH